MQLSDNFTDTFSTIREKLAAFSRGIKATITSQSQICDNLYHIASLLVDRDIDEPDSQFLIDEATQFYNLVNAGEIFTDFSIAGANSETLVNTNNIGYPYKFIKKRVYDAGSATNYTDTLFAVLVDDDGIPADARLPLHAAHFTQGVCDDAMPLNSITTLIPGTSMSVAGLAAGVKDNLDLFSIASEATNLYEQGNLTMANLRNSLANYMDIGTSKVSQLLSIFGENIKDLNVSPACFLGNLKAILSSYVGMRKVDDTFTFPVDSYHVNTSIFLGVDAAVSIITGALSVVATIISPILGLAVNFIGSTVSNVIQAIDVNESDDLVYPEDPTFLGFGQNVSRSTAATAYYGLTTFFSNTNEAIAQLKTPLFTNLCYNVKVQHPNHNEYYPQQEFVIPCLPIAKEGYALLAAIIANGNAMTTSMSYETPPGMDYGILKLSASIAGQATSSRISRRNKILAYMQWCNEHPDMLWYPNTSEDNPDLVRFAVWLNYVVLNFGIWNITEYSTLSFSRRVDIALGLTNKSAFSDIFTRDGLIDLYCILKAFEVMIDEHPYDANSTTSMSDYLTETIRLGSLGSSKKIPSNSVIYQDRATLVNTTLLNTLGSKMFAHEYLSSLTHNSLPYKIIPMDTASPFNPAIIPPRTKVNVWVRLVITIGAVAIATVAAAVAFFAIKKKARLSFNRNFTKANANYNQWLESGGTDTEAYRAYKWTAIKANALGKIFGFGSVDVMNNWVNTPAANYSVTDKLSSISGSLNGDTSYSVKDVLRLIDAGHF